MSKTALFVYGGWDGHTPKESSELFAKCLRERGFETELADTLDVFGDAERLKRLSLIVPAWTMGKLTGEQEHALCDAVASGVGLAGWHGTMCDAFRENTEYQFMTGGQFVAHPGNISPAYDINITNREHAITRGLDDFTLHESEQYYMHVDPAIDVLATTTFPDGTVMPAVWTRAWGRGCVAYASFGHTHQDFENETAREIVVRCMTWATR